MDKLPELTQEELGAAGLLDQPSTTEETPSIEDLPEITDADAKRIEKEMQERSEFEKKPLSAAALSALDSLTFSLSGRFLDKAGLVGKETQQKIAQYNPLETTGGAIIGAVAPAFVSGGASIPESIALQGAKAALKATPAALALKGARATEKIVEKVLKDKIKKEVVRKSLAMGAGGAIEGGLFGANQLAREDALGTAEFNAENAMDAVGTGALTGGLFGAGLVPLGASMRAAGRVAKKAAAEVSAKYGNRADAALELLGFRTVQDKLKFNINPFTRGKADDLADFLEHDINLVKNHSSDKIITRIDDIKKSTADNISQIMDTVDTQIPVSQPGVLNRQKTSFNSAADRIHNILDEIPKIEQNKEIISALIKTGKQMRGLSQRDSGHSLQELWALRKSLDLPLKDKFGVKLSSDVVKRAQFEARQTVQDEILDYANLFNPKVGEELAGQFKRYNLASIAERQIIKKPLKNDLALQYSDYIMGGVGLLSSSPIPLAIQVSKRFMESDLRRKLIVLGGLQKLNNTVTKKIGDTVKTFLESGKTISKGARPASISVLINSNLAREKKDGKTSEAPKNKAQAFKNLQNNISQLQANPEELMNQVAKGTSALSAAAPQAASVMGERLITAIQFLAKKIPKDKSNIGFIGRKHEYQPSSLELAKFERYLQVIEQPTSVLDDLKNGTLTREHVEALAAVYPDMYNRIRVSVLQQIKTDETDLSYSKRVQLGLLLDIPTDPSLLPQSILNLQAGFAQEAQAAADQQGAVNMTVGGTKELDQASRQASDADAFMQRRQEA